MDFDVTRVNSKQVHVFLTVLGAIFESPDMVSRRPVVSDRSKCRAQSVRNGLEQGSHERIVTAIYGETWTFESQPNLIFQHYENY